MRRRSVLGLIVAAACSRAARAQPKIARIGYLVTGTTEPTNTSGFLDAFRQGMRDLGYVEGQSFMIDVRSAEGQVERFALLAEELVGLRVDVIVATNSLAARGAQQATSTIPVVVPVMGDPVRDGLVASLSRPGGNITGLTFLGPQLLPKRLDLLKQALPNAARVAALWHPRAYGERTMSEMTTEAEAAARSLGLELRPVAVQAPDELERAFATIATERIDALIVYPSPMLFSEYRRIIRLAQTYRLATMAMGREFVAFGGLLAYGASIGDLHRQAATYVDKILKGVKPADLPVEQATHFELTVNLTTAKSLDLVIPHSILIRADEVIE